MGTMPGFYEHEPIDFVQVIEVVMRVFGVAGFDNKFSAVVAINFGRLAGFQSLQNTDQAIFNRRF